MSVWRVIWRGLVALALLVLVAAAIAWAMRKDIARTKTRFAPDCVRQDKTGGFQPKSEQLTHNRFLTGLNRTVVGSVLIDS